MGVILDIQKAMYTELTGLGYTVYDYRPVEKPFPYIVIGDDDISSSLTKTNPHYTILSTIDVFSKYEGNKEVKEIMDNILSHVNTTMSVTGWKITYSEVISTGVLLDTLPDVVHGVITLELQISKV